MVEHLIDDQLDVAGFKEGEQPIPTIAFYHPRTMEQIEAALTSDDYSLKPIVGIGCSPSLKPATSSWSSIKCSTIN